jgi:hypothetical protein
VGLWGFDTNDDENDFSASVYETPVLILEVSKSKRSIYISSIIDEKVIKKTNVKNVTLLFEVLRLTE